MLVQVRRQGDDGTETTQTIKVPPAHYRTLGLRMRMGPVVSVQDGSPAAKAKIQPRHQAGNVEGDLIKEIEVERPEGGKLRWVLTPSAQPPEGIKERIIDPLRLPFELNQWAASVANPQDRKVKLTVLREKKHTAEDQLVLEWDSSARYDQPSANFMLAPTPIPGLGLAYHVETAVASVVEKSPATKAKKDDGTTLALAAGRRHHGLLVVQARRRRPAAGSGQARGIEVQGVHPLFHRQGRAAPRGLDQCFQPVPGSRSAQDQAARRARR